MDSLSWTGSLGHWLNPIFIVASFLLIVFGVMSFVRGFGTNENRDEVHWVNYIAPSLIIAFIFVLLSTFSSATNLPRLLTTAETETFLSWVGATALMLPLGFLASWLIFKLNFDMIFKILTWLFCFWLLLIVLYLFLGLILPRDTLGIIGNISKRFMSVWITLAVLFGLSIHFKDRLGFYGRIFDNPSGMVGLGLVFFWVFASIYSGVFGWIATHDVLTQVVQLKDSLPGSPVGKEELYPYYLLGGDHFGRDVFSRAVVGSWEVVKIAPLATLVAFMVGITLGLPAGYYGARVDTVLSFLTNLILAFPVILLFYLLVTPEISDSGIPIAMAALMFVFPVIFLVVFFNSRYYTQPKLRNIILLFVIIGGGWIYLSALSRPGSAYQFLPTKIDFINPAPELLTVFISVVFVNSPTVFRIVRGLTMDLKSRDYVGAAQTRGERPWYIMLWEILPNVRGPLIVDFCLRIGYVTILLGTLGFLGLGLPPSSPDWGSTIAEGSKYLRLAPFPPLVPALCLISLVLGLNLLADGLREESLKD